MNFEKLLAVVRLTRFQNLQLQSVSIFFKSLSIHAFFGICGVIYTFLQCFERFFLCFTQFGGSSHCLSFDKFRGSDPLIIWEDTRRT